MPDGKRTNSDWDMAAGVQCDRCGRDVLRIIRSFSQRNLCARCYQKEDGIFVEETTCQKCSRIALLRTILADGLQDQKITCSACGTYPPR